MKIAPPGRASRARLAATLTAALAVGAALAATQTAAKSAAPKGPTPDITVRVEGLASTLLPPTTVTLTAGPVSKDGKAADSCSGLSALGALQDATKGDWGGTWSKSYREYYVTAIDGAAYSSTADYYWSFWIDNRPAQVGTCGIDPAKGSSILFFPEYDGKSKTAAAASILGISAPASAAPGKPFTVLVTSYAIASGKPAPAAGASVTAGAEHATTTARGTATLKLAVPGRVELHVSAPHAFRDETTICIHKPGAACRA